jgi:hypothetical protein
MRLGRSDARLVIGQSPLDAFAIVVAIAATCRSGGSWTGKVDYLYTHFCFCPRSVTACAWAATDGTGDFI